MDYDRYDAFLHHIYKQTQGDGWFRPSEENLSSGVALRVAEGKFRVFPYENLDLEPFEAAVSGLNPVVAVKVRSAAVHAALAESDPDATSIYVDVNTRIQVLDTMLQLPSAEKEQRAAFIRDERVMVIWSYDLDDIIPTCRDFEDRLIKLLWRSRPHPLSLYSATTPSVAGSASGHGHPGSMRDLNEKLLGDSSNTGSGTSGEDIGTHRFSNSSQGIVFGSHPLHPPIRSPGVRKLTDESVDMEKGEAVDVSDETDDESESKEFKDEKTRGWFGFGSKNASKKNTRKTLRRQICERPMRMYAPVYNGLAGALSFFFIGEGVNILLREFALDGEFIRFAVVAVIPLLYAVSLFFSIQIMQNLSYIVGPIAQYYENSKYYSAIKPLPNKVVDNNLPHVTIQMPVYKESLHAVLTPSIESIKKAMQTYARQGGTSSIFINDDGLQLLPQAERDERIAFYALHGIGWVARPAHDTSSPDGFRRAGRFKKASNMNYGLALSLRLERHLKELQKGKYASGEEPIMGHEEDVDGIDLEERALVLAVEEVFQESGSRHRPWAANGRSCRIGEIVLLVDSDTIVPVDCMRDAARELAECPTVGIIQHESDVMQVAHHYFENGIAYFTRRINRCISMTCANGEVAPFVGHNAFLRWRAIQDAAFTDEQGIERIWSENNVSEDFDMALRLQMRGYIIRWATYTKGEFKEGVSLTVDDELNRWQKYAYGCSELLFNPIVKWWRKGPINKQIHRFLWSDAPLHYKFSMMAYMFSYYGLSASITIGIINYVLLGFEFPVDGFYIHSFEIWLATTVVFVGSGNLGFTLLEYRLGQKSLLRSFLTNMLWIPFFFFFFGGLAIHLSQAILAHLFSYNMTWAATKKEVERSNFFKEVPKILKRFWLSFVIGTFIIAAVIVLSLPLVPIQWRIDGESWAVIFPLVVPAACHILFPIVLNPWLMIFSY